MTAVRTRPRPARSAPAPYPTRRPSRRSTQSHRSGPRASDPRRPDARRAEVRGIDPRRAPGRRQAPARLTVHPRRRVSLRTTVALAAATFFAVLVGSVTIQAQRIEAQARLDALDAQLTEARDEHRRLRAEVAIAESPERIMAEATALGMVEPGPVLPLAPVGSGAQEGDDATGNETRLPPTGDGTEVASP